MFGQSTRKCSLQNSLMFLRPGKTGSLQKILLYAHSIYGQILIYETLWKVPDDLDNFSKNESKKCIIKTMLLIKSYVNQNNGVFFQCVVKNTLCEESLKLSRNHISVIKIGIQVIFYKAWAEKKKKFAQPFFVFHVCLVWVFFAGEWRLHSTTITHAMGSENQISLWIWSGTESKQTWLIEFSWIRNCWLGTEPNLSCEQRVVLKIKLFTADCILESTIR